MKKSKYLPFKLTKLFSLTLKSIVLFIGLNIILTTILILIKEQIHENFKLDTSYSYFRDTR